MERIFGTSIRLKLAGFVALVILVLAGGLSWVSYIFAHRTLSQQIHERLSLTAFNRRQILLEYLQRQEERVLLIASRTRLRQILARGDAAEMHEEGHRILTDVRRAATDFRELWIVDADGRVVIATDETRLGADMSSRPEFALGRERAGFVSIEFADNEYDGTAVAPALLDGKFLGVVMVRVDTAQLLRTLSDAIGLGETGELLLGELQGEKIHYLLPNRNGRRIPDLPLSHAPAMARALAGESGFLHGREYRGADVLAAYLPVKTQKWGVVAKIDSVEGYAPIAWLRRMFVMVELTALALGLAAAFLLAQRFTRPISRMARMARAIAEGGLQARVVVETSDEIGELARSFNRMTEELAHSQAVLEDAVRARTAELEQTNAALQVEVGERKRAEEDLARQQMLLQSLMDNIPDHIYFKDTDCRFIRVNKAMAQWAGVGDSKEIEGKTDFHIFSTEHAQAAFDDEQQLMRTGQPVVGKEERETWPDGRSTWVSTTKLPLRDKDGRIIGTFGISRDITARKQAEQRLEKYAHALTRRTIQTQEDLVLAREIQMAFLPQHYPTFPRGAPAAETALRFEHRYQPASTLGGDFFDVLALSDTRAGVLICDVMGHGMRSALVTAILRGLVNEYREYADEPGEFLTQINEALLNNLKSCGSPIFATAFYLIIDASAGQLRFANAGHPSPVCLRREQGVVEVLRGAGKGNGSALGLFRETKFVTQSVGLAPGDAVLLFTDGLYEVPGADGEPFGQERLLAAVQERLGSSSGDLLTELIEAAREFAHNNELNDDVCLVTAELVRICNPVVSPSALAQDSA